ncbi:hypothetical protein Tco_1242802 [Tanacetum coccineum]
MSSAEAKYVTATRCYASILWKKSQLSDYDIYYKMVPIFCDNTSAIAISNNPILYLRTKHNDIRYHFIRDYILKRDIELHFIPTEYQLADIFTKSLDEPTFTKLKIELGITAVPHNHFPSTDEAEQCPLKEFLIKFLVLNGQRPLTLDLTPSVHPLALIIIMVLGGNYSSTEQVNFIQQLLAYSLIIGTEVDIEGIIYSDLITKLLNKFLPSILSNSNFTKDPYKVTNIELMAHMIVVNSHKDSMSPLPLVAKPKKGKSQTMTPTLPKSQGPEIPGALFKKSKGPKDKDLGGKIPPADMELVHPPVVDLSGTSAKYQVDQTQLTRLRYQSLPKNKGKPLHEGELDTQPIVLSTYAYVRPFPLSDDKSEEDWYVLKYTYLLPNKMS